MFMPTVNYLRAIAYERDAEKRNEDYRKDYRSCNK